MIVWWINFVTKSWRSEDHSCFKTITHFEIGYNNTLLVEGSNELRCFYSKLLSLRFPLQERAAVEYGGDEILPPVLGALTSLSPRAWRCSDSSPTEMPYLCVISFWPKAGNTLGGRWTPCFRQGMDKVRYQRPECYCKNEAIIIKKILNYSDLLLLYP